MPTVLRQHGFSVRIYTDDHEPAHVHVIYADGLAKIQLTDLSLMMVRNLKTREIRAAMELVEANRSMLLAAWQKIHGGKR